jgi:hypothetical protein
MFMRWVNNTIGCTSACWTWRIIFDGEGRCSMAGKMIGSLRSRENTILEYKIEETNTI